jgi:hypothetical protein
MNREIQQMKPIPIYLRIVLAALSALTIWGLICPILISADIDIVVILGILLIFVEPLLIYWIIKPIFSKHLTNKTNEKE